jgi:hypothetical protein
MPLPTIENTFSYVKCTMPDGRNIGIRKWKVRDEKELLFTIDSDDNPDQSKVNHIVNFLRTCADSAVVFNTLSEAGIKAFAMEARKLSKGDTIEYSFNCPGSGEKKCGFKVEDRISITKDSQLKAYESHPVTVNEHITLTLCDLPYEKSLQIDAAYTSEVKRNFYKLLNRIDSMTIDGVTYTEFTQDEVENYLDELDSNDMGKIVEQADAEFSSADLSKKVKCVVCGKETSVKFEDLLSFLVL